MLSGLISRRSDSSLKPGYGVMLKVYFLLIVSVCCVSVWVLTVTDVDSDVSSTLDLIRPLLLLLLLCFQASSRSPCVPAFAPLGVSVGV